MSGPVRLLDRATLERCGAWDFEAATTDVVRTLTELAAGRAVMPPEVALHVGGVADDAPADVGLYALPAFIGGEAAVAGLKWTSHRPETRGQEGSRIVGVLVLNDPVSLAPVAILESGVVGAVRTAAVSWVAIERLERGTARRVGVIGAGSQAEAHVRMVADRLPRLDSVLLFNRTRARAERLCERLAPSCPWPLEVVDRPDVVFASADIVITCTSAETPYADPAWVRPGLLVVHVGMFELGYDAIDRFDRIVVDAGGEFKASSRQSLFRMYREGRLDEGRVTTTLVDLVSGEMRVGPNESVLFNSFGLAVFDVVVGARLLRAAIRLGEGQEWRLS